MKTKWALNNTVRTVYNHYIVHRTIYSTKKLIKKYIVKNNDVWDE